MLVGQLLVCGVFGNLVSKWPLQGSVYAWSRELIGPRYGWFTGWAYSWGLTLALARSRSPPPASSRGALGRQLAQRRSPSSLVALGVLLFGSVANMIGGGS